MTNALIHAGIHGHNHGEPVVILAALCLSFLFVFAFGGKKS